MHILPFRWNYANCVNQVGGEGTALSDTQQSGGTGKWYVHWDKFICRQDCDGPAPCGGHAKYWQELYESKEICCERRLGWIESKQCLESDLTRLGIGIVRIPLEDRKGGTKRRVDISTDKSK